MISVNPKDAIIRKQVQSVEFGYYTDQDVRDRSVVEITSSQAFDPNHTALPNGLYDPRLGATTTAHKASNNNLVCITCALPAVHCPGHFGHIELAVPVYHPLLLPQLLQLLRVKCFHCHALQAGARQLAIYRAKFHLLYQHEINQVLELDNALAVAVQNARRGQQPSSSLGDSSSSSPNKQSAARVAATAMDQLLRSVQPTVEQYENDDDATSSTTTKLTSFERQIRKQLIHECLAISKGTKRCCQRCGAVSPKIRQDSYNKLFQSFSKKALAQNQAENIVMESAILKQAKTKKKATDGYDSEDTDRNAEMDESDEDDMSMGEEDDDDDDDEEEDDDESNSGDESDSVNAVSKGAGRKGDNYMHPQEVLAQVKLTWETDPFLCNCLFGSGPSFDKTAWQIFFLQAIPVPPSRFRPPMYLNGMAVEHSQTQHLSNIIQRNEMVRNFFATNNEPRAYEAWIDLQTRVNCLMDSSKDPSASSSASSNTTHGIRQVLERKEGLFRKNMMGKRVDYACRSVISPDPYVGASEIGLPRYFATVLTYPTPVTDLNVKEMRLLVERGPHEYPGARWVEFEGGSKRVDLSRMKRHKREAIAAQLLTHLKKRGMPAIVGRQLRDGDYVLMNRQPTLHKPGIMAHRVRILHNPTQKTIRMHYANCNTYNADFDGDEMNCHFPQSDLGRAEAQYIAQTDLQYIVPTDGSPLRGLIQDHVVGGVKLTKRDTFLEKWEYQQLLFAALASLPGLEVIQSNADIELVPPAIIKPRELWTGKQVITTLLLHLRNGSDKNGGKSELPGLSTERKSKTPSSAFGAENEEHLVLIRDGELLRGVLDKAAFGATDFSLVHAAYEAYGPEKAGLLLNSLGRLFTAYIQYYSGHSCRVEDLVLTEEAEKERRDLVQRAYNIGSRAAKAWGDSEGGKVPVANVKDQEGSDTPLKPIEAASASAKIGKLLSGNEGKENSAALDGFMQGQLNPLASDIVKKSLPHGLAVPFPHNTFGIMTTTGAKGSIVNQSQVTCALGQQALEGRRVPRLNSGRTLPSFAPYDPNPRADGFVMDRFLTGIRPQEYYFHCMAGREGLVDTAVKTSRSGYLQRCLVKHLEELKICYDHTVRNAEGGVVQFLYGEDGLDPTKASYLDCSDKSFEFMVRNFDAMKLHNAPLPSSSIDIAARDAVKHKSLLNDTFQFPVIGERVLARKLRAGTEWKRGALCQGWHKAIVLKIHDGGKSVDLKYTKDGQKAKRVPIEANLGRCGSSTILAESSIATIVKPAAADPILSSTAGGHRLGSSGACVSERVASAAMTAMKHGKLSKAMSSAKISADDLSSLIGAKFSSSICDPGEAVGCIAAQSIGEPSTQMTLNTFHLAGAGANVTLGIPRLREIIMTASRELKTPTMSVPLREDVTEKQALRLTRYLSKLTLMELICGNHGISVTEKLQKGDAGDWMRAYYVKIKFHPAERIREAFGLSLHNVAKVVAKSFVPLLARYMKQELRRADADRDDVFGGESTTYVIDGDEESTGGEEKSGESNVVSSDDLGDEEEDEKSDGDVLDEEDGADASRYRGRASSVSYENDENESDAEVPNPGSTPETIDGDAKLNDELTLSDKASLVVSERANMIELQKLEVSPESQPLLMVGLVEKAASATLVRSRKNISQAFVNEEEGRGRCLQIVGVNFEEIWKLDNIVHDKLISNDIWAVRCAYGVEAARSSIVHQIKSVFGAYGIEVDPRHLSLIADYMTFEGGFKAMNRIGMEGSSSPFLQMSFETTVHFLRQAALSHCSDNLETPSGNLVLGRPVQHGTGSFALLSRVS